MKNVMSALRARAAVGRPTRPPRPLSEVLGGELVFAVCAVFFLLPVAQYITVGVLLAAAFTGPFVYVFIRWCFLRRKVRFSADALKAIARIDAAFSDVRALVLTPTLREVPEALDAGRDARALRESALKELTALERQVKSRELALSTAEVTRKEITDSVEGVLKQMVVSLTLLKEEKEVPVNAPDVVEPSEVFSSRLARMREATQEVKLRKDSLEAGRAEIRTVSKPPARRFLR